MIECIAEGERDSGSTMSLSDWVREQKQSHCVNERDMHLYDLGRSHSVDYDGDVSTTTPNPT